MQKQTHPVDLADYNLFMALAGTEPDYLQEAIKDYETILMDSGNRFKVTFQVSHQDAERFGGWTILACSPGLVFYDFINMPSWFMYYGDDNETRKASFYLGLAMHRSDPLESFVFMPAKYNPHGDMLDGTFQNGASFSIYMPEAFVPGGNIEIQSPANQTDALTKTLRFYDLAPECFDKEQFADGRVLEGMFEP